MLSLTQEVRLTSTVLRWAANWFDNVFIFSRTLRKSWPEWLSWVRTSQLLPGRKSPPLLLQSTNAIASITIKGATSNTMRTTTNVIVVIKAASDTTITISGWTAKWNYSHRDYQCAKVPTGGQQQVRLFSNAAIFYRLDFLSCND